MTGRFIQYYLFFLILSVCPNLSAQYVHTFDSFFIKGSTHYEKISPNTSSLNIETLPSLGVISHRAAFLNLATRNFKVFHHHPCSNPSSLNLPKVDDLIIDFRLSSSQETLLGDIPDSMAFASDYNPVFRTGLSSLLPSFFPSKNPSLEHVFTLIDKENSWSGDFFNFSKNLTFKSNSIGDIARYEFSEITEPLSSFSNFSQDNFSSENWHHIKSQINERDMQIKSQEFLVPESLLKRYPVFSFNEDDPKLIFNIFEENPLISLDSENLQADENLPVRTSKYRRANYTFEWEIADFTSTGTNNDYFDFPVNTFSSDDIITIRIKPIIGGTANRDGNGTDLNSSATEELNTPKYILDGLAYNYDSGTGVQKGISPEIWTDAVSGKDWDREWDLMRITGNQPEILIDASAMQYYMNWYYGDWGFTGTGPEYNLIYYSAVPEPSTYFMTGILLCLIGCSRQSRQSIKSLWLKALPNQSEKENTCKVKNRLS